MKFWVISLDFHRSPIELRAKASKLSTDGFCELTSNCRERLWLSTCNRVEMYGLSVDGPEKILKEWMHRLEIEEAHSKNFFCYEDEAALVHLFRVASSLESMVVGETQITGQVKKAYDFAIREEWIGPFLHRCFQCAFRIAKSIRTKTEVGRLAVSIPSIGVKLAESILGNLEAHSIGIIGLGEIGRVAAEHFASVQPKSLTLYNRTKSIADNLAKNLNIDTHVADSYEEILSNVEVAVVAADGVKISAQMLEEIERRKSLRFLLDLTVPPSVARVNLKKLFVFYIDDLKKIASENTSLRAQELQRAEEMLLDEAHTSWTSMGALSLSQTFGRLASKVDLLTQQELSDLRAKIPSLSLKEWNEIEKMAYRLSNKVVQDPMIEIKSQLEMHSEPDTLLQFFRHLFKI